MEKEQRLFKKAAFGGFRKEDVIAYIEKMKREFAEYKQQVEETMDALHAQISEPGEAEAAPFATSEPADADHFAIDSISEATERLKEVGDALCKNLNELIDKMQKAPAPVERASATGTPGDKKAAAGEFTKDAALVESVLPAYLR